MHADIKTKRDGTVLLRMDQEAARATFASVIFASRYHEGIGPLEEVAKRALGEESQPADRRTSTCR